MKGITGMKKILYITFFSLLFVLAVVSYMWPEFYELEKILMFIIALNLLAIMLVQEQKHND